MEKSKLDITQLKNDSMHAFNGEISFSSESKGCRCFQKSSSKNGFLIVFALIYTCQSRSHYNFLFEVKFCYHNHVYFQRILKYGKLCLLHFVAFFHVASLLSKGVENKKVGVDNEKALELTNSPVFHRCRQ